MVLYAVTERKVLNDSIFLIGKGSNPREDIPLR
jgi:hypothetical protein